MLQNGRRLLMVRPRPSLLRTIRTLVVHLLLVHLCHGQSQLIGLHQPMVASVGDDVVLPCHLKSAVDVSERTLEWARADLNPRFVFVWRAGQDLVNVKNPSFRGRTSLFTNELKHGNISLKLTKVQISDGGKYRCYIPDLETDSVVELLVASGDVSSPVISLVGIDQSKGGVVLHCKYKGWFPEPAVQWLDGEGNLVSAGPPETLRGPDGLYTVSSRVTVEKHSSSFTCRVQQKDVNQTRETHIYVADDFFEVWSSSSVTAGLAAGLAVCILLLLSLLVFMWRRRPNIIKTKRGHMGETDEEEEKSLNSNKSEEGGDTTQPPSTDKAVSMPVFTKKKNKKHEEQMRRRKAVEKLKSLKKELEEKIELKQAELQQLQEKMKNMKDQEKQLKEELDYKHNELRSIQASIDSLPLWSVGREKEEKRKKEEVENEVTKLKDDLEFKTTRIKELTDKQAEVLQLQQDYLSMVETSLQVLKDLDSDNMEVEPSRSLQKNSVDPLRNEKQRLEDDEKDLNELKTRNQQLEEKLREQETKRSEAEEEVKRLKKLLEDGCSEFAAGVDQWGRFICITNTTQQEQNLQGWMLEVRINIKKPLRYLFEEELIISPGNIVKLWSSGHRGPYQPNDLEWKDLKPMKSGDTVHCVLFKRSNIV